MVKLNTWSCRSVQVVQWLIALIEDIGLVLSTYKVAHIHLDLQFQGMWCPILILMHTAHNNTHMYMQTKILKYNKVKTKCLFKTQFLFMPSPNYVLLWGKPDNICLGIMKFYLLQNILTFYEISSGSCSDSVFNLLNWLMIKKLGSPSYPFSIP